jgi:hypothetical protein
MYLQVPNRHGRVDVQVAAAGSVVAVIRDRARIEAKAVPFLAEYLRVADVDLGVHHVSTFEEQDRRFPAVKSKVTVTSWLAGSISEVDLKSPTYWLYEDCS